MNGVIHRHIFFGGKLAPHTIAFLVALLLCAYFSYHLIHGNRSLVRLIQLNDTIVTRQALADDLALRRTALETKVAMMRPGAVDRDLLEERIQAVLGYAAPEDVIVHLH